jgi:hypothetical protein
VSRPIDADLEAAIRADGARLERERQTKLMGMRIPETETIIDRALRDGDSPDDVALECLGALQSKKASNEMMAKLRRDAAPAGGVPASEAPFIANKGSSLGAEGGENKGKVSLLTASLQKQRKARGTNGQGEEG